MRVYNELKMMLIVCITFVRIVNTVCPNECSGHGVCESSVCKCFDDSISGESYLGSDCSIRSCVKGNGFSVVSSLSSLFDGAKSRSSSSPSVTRELSKSEYVKTRVKELSGYSIELNADGVALDGEDGRLWKVTGLGELTKDFSQSGLILNCKFSGTGDPQSQLRVISHNGDNAYVLFEKKVTKIDNSPSNPSPADETTSQYSSVVCNDILSVINDLTQINPVTLSTQSPRRLLSNNNNTRELNSGIDSFSWKGYSPILKEMGLLKKVEQQDGGKYESNSFVFACFSPPGQSELNFITGKKFKFYRKVKAEEVATDNVQFTITGEDAADLPQNGDMCLCVMDYDGNEIDLEDSEISENIRKMNNEYYVGKYDKTTEDLHVVIGIISAATGDGAAAAGGGGGGAAAAAAAAGNIGGGKIITITKDNLKGDDELYFGVNRIVYGTVIEGGIFKEIPIKMASNTATEAITNGILLPYLRSSAISQLTPPPKQEIVNKESKPFYKAYYFYDNLLNSLKKEGGILKCTYTPTPRERMLNIPQSVDVDVDVKGIIRDSKNVIIYSYLEITDSSVNTGTLECSEIKFSRNDMTRFNGLSPLKVPDSQAAAATNEDNKITWSGYGPILQNMGYKESEEEDKNINFGCFKKDDKSRKIETFKSSLSYSSGDPINAIFTFNEGKDEDGEYLCFMKTRYNGEDIIIEESDIKDGISYNSSSSSYYYGEYIINEKTVYLNEEDNEVIILSSKSTIELKSNPSSIITIPDDGTIDEITLSKINELKTSDTFYLKVMKKKDTKYEIQTVTCINPTISPPSPRRRSLTTQTPITITFSYSVDSSYTYAEGDITFNVIYLKTKSEESTTKPTSMIKTIDVNSYFYEISNFLEDIRESLPLIGGKIQCKIDNKNSVGIIDVRGKNEENIYLKFDKPIINGRRMLLSNENEILLENIRDCEILNIRKDMSLYNVIKLDKMNYIRNEIIWFGYGNIFSELKCEIVCYNPSSNSDKEMKFYDKIKINRVKNLNVNVYDIKMSILNDEKPNEGEICYILSDKEGKNIINIEESELFNLIRKEKKSGKYYFGKNVIVDIENGKSVENKKEDGSISITLTKEAIVTKETDAIKEMDKMNIYDLNKESPSIGIPPSFIGFESEKMLYPGTTIIIRFIINGNDYGSQSSQIIRIEKEVDESTGKERFKIYLSKPISIPPEILKQSSKTRLRSLASTPESADILMELNWLSEGSTHISIECSGQGICDRESGLCKCFVGFSGSACQRLDCPSNCNGNGRCVSLSELLGNDELEEYKGYGNKHLGKYTYTPNPSPPSSTADKEIEFDNQVYGCLCDKRHRGYDCSLIECPSGEDPEGVSNKDGLEYRDCSGRGICNYSSGICECFSGFSGEGCQDQIQTM